MPMKAANFVGKLKKLAKKAKKMQLTLFKR